MPNLLDMPDNIARRRQYELFDDFLWYSDTLNWTKVLTGGATIAVNDGPAGILTISGIDSTLDREAYLRSTTAIYLFAAGKPVALEAMLQWSEANTNKADIIFGLMNSVASGALGNGGTGPKTSFSGAVLYKLRNGTSWNAMASIGSTQTSNLSNQLTNAANNLATTYTRLRIEFRPIPGGSTGEVTYFVDGQQLKDTGNPPRPIKHVITYTGAVNMQLMVGLKQGSTSPEVLNVDYLSAWQMRTPWPSTD